VQVVGGLRFKREGRGFDSCTAKTMNEFGKVEV
jgi:hypothetical protein